MAKKQEQQKPREAAAPSRSWRFARYCLVLWLAVGVALTWLSMLTFSAQDPPATGTYPPINPVHNYAGVVGAHVAYWTRYWLGCGAYMGLLFLSIAAVIWMLGGRVRDLVWRIIGALLLTAATSAALYVYKPGLYDDANTGLLTVGVLGLGLGRFLLERFSHPGSCLIIAFAFGAGLMLTADNLMLRLPSLGKRAWARRGDLSALAGTIGKTLTPARTAPAASAASGNVRGAGEPRFSGVKALLGARRNAAASPAKAEKPDKDRKNPPLKPAPSPAGSSPADGQPKTADKLNPQPPRPPQAQPAAKAQMDPSPRAEPQRQAPAKPPAARKDEGPASKDAKAGKEDKEGQKEGDYQLPPTNILAESTDKYSEAQEQQAQRNRDILQQTFNDFHIEAQVVGYQTGPVITLFELALAPGVKVSQVANLATDVARALSVPGVRIVPPRFGKDTIGVEVPNLDKEIVRIRELMTHAPDADKKMHLPLYLGKDAGGNAIVADLAGMPHMLIAGTTGSGKSVCINTIIVSLLMTRRPEEVRLILVDPKMVEMAAFESVPHLLCPIVNDMRRAEEILEWAATKMDERYELLKECNVKNIAGYNKLTAEEIYKRLGVESEEEKLRIPTKMPYYVIIVDELADLIMTSEGDVESHIIRIAQKARAVGIHLILATQRPSANVVTGLIRSNMPCRISFRVASRLESRIVLDQNGAEVLLGQGDMLFLQPGSASLIRAQGTYVSDSEIKTVVQALREHGEPQYCVELMKLNAAGIGEGDGERDEMFDQAVEIVLASNRGSVSLLQRRLQVGYSRASRIIDQMADAGLLGDYKGSQARECLMTLEDWRAMKSTIAKDQSGESAANGEPTSS